MAIDICSYFFLSLFSGQDIPPKEGAEEEAAEIAKYEARNYWKGSPDGEAHLKGRREKYRWLEPVYRYLFHVSVEYRVYNSIYEYKSSIDRWKADVFLCYNNNNIISLLIYLRRLRRYWERRVLGGESRPITISSALQIKKYSQ